MQWCSLWFEELHIWRVSHKKQMKKQIWWSEHCRLKATDFSVAQRGIVGGSEVTPSVNPSHPVEFLSSFHLPHLFMFETRGRKTNLWILFHPCTWFPSEDACCRHTGAMFIFIFIYWNELHFASVKGNSLNTTSVHAFIFTYSQTPLENKGCFLV